MNRVVYILLIGLMMACDTERNIPLPEDHYFLKFYGVEGEQTGVDFVLTSDNAIVMVGNSKFQPTSNQMIYVVKVDLNGNMIWENMIGLSNRNNSAKDIELHPDGRLIIAGETEMAVGNRDAFLKIMSTDGAELDSTRYDILNGSDEEVKTVSIISGGLGITQNSFIVSGSTTAIEGTIGARDTREGMHLRFLDLPTLPWPSASWDSRTGKDNSEDVVVKIIRVEPNKLLGFGYTNTESNLSGDFKFWIFAITDAGAEAGDLESLFSDLGLTSEDEILKSVLDVDIDDPFYKGFLLNGIAVDNAGNKRGYLVKVPRDINFMSPPPISAIKQVYSISLGTGSEMMNGFYNPINNDYLFLTTQNVSTDLLDDLSLFKFDREVQPVWGPQVFGGESLDEAGGVLQLSDGKIMVIGTMTVGGRGGQRKMALMKLNSEGKLLR